MNQLFKKININGIGEVPLYLSQEDRHKIENYVKEQIKTNEKIDIQQLIIKLKLYNDYPVYEISAYIKKFLDKDTFHYDAIYLNKNNKGHIVFRNDYFYNNCYLHQYVLHKELEVDLDILKECTIHHKDGKPSNNDMKNLFPFYDQVSHRKFHGATNEDIFEFSRHYVLNLLKDNDKDKDNNDDDKCSSIRVYLEVLDKLEDKLLNQ